VELLDGTAITLEQHRGQEIVLLDFWATWCGPCRRELPVLVEVAEQYRSRGVVLYAVNQGETPDEIRRFLDQAKLAVTVALDTADTGGSVYGVEGIPTLVVIDKQGIVQAVRVGFSPSLKAELTEQLDALLAVRS
jgi:thiol-disulfide isomerase/thioredoxin